MVVVVVTYLLTYCPCTALTVTDQYRCSYVCVCVCQRLAVCRVLYVKIVGATSSDGFQVKH